MSFKVNNQLIKIFGVINLTPDSFSDGSLVSSPASLASKINSQIEIDGIDIGAESTAPMNDSISAEEEIKRLTENLLPSLKSWRGELSLSLDTYRIDTIKWLLKHAPTGLSLVWNDVSGLMDEEVLDLLKANPSLKYVYCFNPMQKRVNGSSHMNFVQAGDVIEQARAFFGEGLKKVLSLKLTSQVIADPCFGFAKTREQNIDLAQRLPQLMEEMSYPEWMWGISRKSFLRNPVELNPKDPQVQSQLDGLGNLVYQEWLDRLVSHHTIYIRTHAPESALGLKGFQALRDLWKRPL
jgi:dihydropteroate synthase